MKVMRAQEWKASQSFSAPFATSLLELRASHGGPPLALTAPLLQMLIESPIPRRKEFFVAIENDQVVATMGANISEGDPKRGYIGFFEIHKDHLNGAKSRPLAAPQIFSDILKASTQFLRASGADEIYAPVNYSTWFSYRFQLPFQDSNRFMWEPTNPPSYPLLFQENGFEPTSLYKTTATSSLSEFAAKFERSHAQVLTGEYKIKAFAELGDRNQLLEPLYHLSMHGFTDNFLFEPLPFEMFKSIYVPILNKGDLSMAYVTVDSVGKPVGFCLSFAEGDLFVCKTMAVLPEARSRGLSNAMMYASAQVGLQKGLKRAVTALVRAGIQSESYTSKTTHEWQHEYVLLKMRS